MSKIFDILVIGGGINGAGIARDAAGRGLSVMLAEQGDLACATSSASTKLIHGGLRYLEYYEFRLVREALKEREVLLAAAPHIIWPMKFILPHDKHLRPSWMIRMGLFLYDHLGGHISLPKSRGVDLRGSPLKDEYTKGFSYSDCWVEDSRMVVLNAMAAREKGAEIHTRTRCLSVRPESNLWRVQLEDTTTGLSFSISARSVVNAAGPWVSGVVGLVSGLKAHHNIRLVKGSHIVVPKLHDGDFSYILQNTDRRIVFIIPYEKNYSLIGTTEADFSGDPLTAQISREEILYLCDVANRHLKKQISPSDVVWTYSGVRPLIDDGADSATAATREYVLEMDRVGGLPVLSVYGGKITTFRMLAEKAVNLLCGALGAQAKPWTRTECLPGGDALPDLQKEFPWLPPELAQRYLRAYGSRALVFLENKTGLSGIGRHFGDGVYQAEIDYLIQHEWALTAEDILWRRSKLGLHVSAETKSAVETYLEEEIGNERAVSAGH